MSDMQVPPQLIRYLPHCLCKQRIKLRALVQRNGLRQYALFCQQTQQRGSFIPKGIAADVAEQHGVHLDEIPVARDNRSGCCDGGGCEYCIPECCARCGSHIQVQYHHWAPRYLFDDANDWPMSPLCASCHRRWHATVTPTMHARQAG